MPSTVLNNTLSLSLSSIIGLSISFLFNVFLARALGVDQFGDFYLAISFTAIFSVLVEFSLDSLIVRDVARTPARAASYFGNTLVLKGVLSLVAVILILITAYIMCYPTHVRVLIYVLSLGLLFDGVKRCCVSLFEAVQKMQFAALLLVSERALFAILGLAAVSLYGTVTAVSVCYIFVQGFISIAGYLMVYSRLGFAPRRPDYALCKKLTRNAFPFFLTSMTAALYADIDKLFLFSIQSGSAVGLYAAAYKLIAIPIQFSNAFHRALYPVLSKYAATQDRVLLAEMYRRSIRYLMLGAVPIGVGMTVWAEPLMRATFGEAYLRGTIALQILVWAYMLEFFNPFLSRVLYAIGRERSVLTAVIVGTVSNISLNILLIPIYSLTGAAIATLVSASLIFVMLWLSIFPIFHDVCLSTIAIRPLLAGLSMWASCILLSRISPIVAALVAGCVYIGFLVLTKAISSEELLAVRRAMRTVAWVVIKR